MRLDHAGYTKLVVAAYNKKKANNELSPLLAQSTPANIRRECANVYQERYAKKDEPTLRAFFGPAEQGRKFLSVIQEFDVSKFKPLDTYLKGAGRKGINDRNLELLAWLIDFRHRPYVFGMDVILDEDALSIIGRPIGDPLPPPPKPGIEQNTVSENPAPNEGNPTTPLQAIAAGDEKKHTSKTARAIFWVGIISLGGLYFIWQQDKDGQMALGNANTGCMYWAEDHYEQVPCNEDPKGRLILALDKEKLKNFRKITRADTITEWSIGKIYYLKNNRVLEYYTIGGNHPVDVTRTLKVLSPYMFDTYLRKKQVPGKDSLADSNKKL